MKKVMSNDVSSAVCIISHTLWHKPATSMCMLNSYRTPFGQSYLTNKNVALFLSTRVVYFTDNVCWIPHG